MREDREIEKQRGEDERDAEGLLLPLDVCVHGSRDHTQSVEIGQADGRAHTPQEEACDVPRAGEGWHRVGQG